MYTDEIKRLEESGKWKKRAAVIAASIAVFVLLVTAFFVYRNSSTKVVLTTGLKKDEVFKVGNLSCTLPEAMVYLTNMQNRYESVYGPRIWEDRGGVSLVGEAKAQVLEELVQVKSMVLLAGQKGVSLDKKEEEKAAAAGKEYFGSLTETEIAALQISEKLTVQMYREYALAEKVYRQIVEDVNPEISDDEARTITVLQIRVNSLGEAEEILRRIREEEADFEAVAETSSQDSVIRYSFGKGEAAEPIETAAFNLGKDEVSEPIQSGEDFYLLKCISTFDENQTQLNKVKILERRRNEAFHTEYNAFVNTLTRQLNRELWDTAEFLQEANMETSGFFTVYNTYFKAEPSGL